MERAAVNFMPGARVQLSARGRAALARSTATQGTIVRHGFTGHSWRVQFDGLETKQTLHETFLELVAQGPLEREVF